MKEYEISTYTDLCLRIQKLKAEKYTQEEELQRSFKALIYSLDPISIVKESLHNLAKDNIVQSDLAKVGLNIGTNFIIDQVLGRYRSIKGFISSVLVEKISIPWVNNNASKIISVISGFMQQKEKKEADTTNK